MALQREVRYINDYVSGSIAYQPERKSQKKQSAQLPKMKKQQKLVIAIDPLALGGIVMAMVLAVMLLVGGVNLINAKQEAQIMKDYVASLQEKNARLQDTYSSSYDLEEIREIALTMGMVPIEQVPHIQMQVVVPEAPVEPTAWENFWAFMVGLFA